MVTNLPSVLSSISPPHWAKIIQKSSIKCIMLEFVLCNNCFIVITYIVLYVNDTAFRENIREIDEIYD